MEKRSIVGAVYAESLVFESGFGFAEGPATGSSSEVTAAHAVNSRRERGRSGFGDRQADRHNEVADPSLGVAGTGNVKEVASVAGLTGILLAVNRRRKNATRTRAQTRRSRRASRRPNRNPTK